MQRSRAILIILAVVSAVFVLGQFLFVPKTYVNSAFLRALQAPRLFLDAVFNHAALVEQLRDAQLENQSVRAQLALALARPELVREKNRSYVRVPVYSTYPLNNVSRLLVAAGAEHGVSEGMTVLAAPGLFIGEVVRVYERQSEVRTVFDPGWELPVTIGTERIDSLLIGGPEPRLALISKKKPAVGGMPVYTAHRKYTYSLLLGAMGDPSDSEQNLFQEAPLVTSYLLGEVQRVYIDVTK